MLTIYTPELRTMILHSAGLQLKIVLKRLDNYNPFPYILLIAIHPDVSYLFRMEFSNEPILHTPQK